MYGSMFVQGHCLELVCLYDFGFLCVCSQSRAREGGGMCAGCCWGLMSALHPGKEVMHIPWVECVVSQGGLGLFWGFRYVCQVQQGFNAGTVGSYS